MIPRPKVEQGQTSYPAEMQNLWMSLQRKYVADAPAVLFSTETNGLN